MSYLAKGTFLMMLAVIGVILTLGIYQVPQPWRGLLVGWLLFMASAGTFILRLVRHHYQYKSLQLTTRRTVEKPPVKRARKLEPARLDSLKVVMSESGGGGRRTIR